MDSRLIKYNIDQINQAESFVCITFFADWCGVEDVIIKKITEKCIWPQNTSQARVEKDQIGGLHYHSAIVIKGDEDQAIKTYFERLINEKEQIIKNAQETIAQAQSVIDAQDHMKHYRGENRKWVRS